MTTEVRNYPRYFYKCNVCDGSDHGVTFYDYEIVDCPSCGTQNMTRWEALPNLSREWSYCQAFGHEWATPPGAPATREICARCTYQRDLITKKK